MKPLVRIKVANLLFLNRHAQSREVITPEIFRIRIRFVDRILAYPQAPSKASVDGALYARFTANAEALRQSLGLRDLGELDVLFNFGYW